jgi:hypothetical protein
LTVLTFFSAIPSKNPKTPPTHINFAQEIEELERKRVEKMLK